MRYGVRGAESRVINSLVAGKFPLYIKRLRGAQVFHRCGTPGKKNLSAKEISSRRAKSLFKLQPLTEAVSF